MAGGWARHEDAVPRKAELPHDWGRIRAYVLARDGHRCVWVHEGERCIAHATDCDHIGDRHDHSVHNLRSLCATHHRVHTSTQGNAERWRHRAKRKPERHPGAIE